MRKNLLKAKCYSNTLSTSVSEERNMYSNAFYLVDVYLCLYSTEVDGEED